MAKAVPLQTKIRQEVGTKGSRRCRREGLLPGVIYGHRKDSVPVAVPQHEFLHHIHHGVHLLELQMADAAPETVLIKDVQYDSLGTNPVHVDFTRVDLSERVTVAVPVILRGTPAGVSEGGTLQQPTAELEISCVVTDIPEEIRVRVNDLKVGDTLKAADVKLPEGAALVSEPETVIAAVTVVAEEVTAVEGAAAEAGAEPEVIGRGKEEEEGEAGE
ncbi:MAG: 50S ribosomal protein L25 [Phycisphaerae bacterium]|nr:50S ribosomal protein L25 [Phycisphaerae bacterium]